MKKNRKHLIALGIAVLLSISMNMTAFAGWEQGTGDNAGKWRYQFEDGNYAMKRENIPQAGCWIKDRDSEQEAIYYFDENGWLYTSTKVYDGVWNKWREVNEKGQALEDGQIIRLENGSSESTDERLINTDGWIHENDNTYYRYADGTYAKDGWLWLDRQMTKLEMCYYFDSEGRLLKNTTTPDGSKVNNSGAWYSGNNETRPEEREVQADTEDNSVLSEEGYTRGLSNTVSYLLTHSMDENNNKYEIEKAVYNKFLHSDGRKTTTYFIKYKGAPIVAWYTARADDENEYYCREVWDASTQRNAILCDMPDPYDYDKIRGLYEGIEPYYDWKGIGGAIISHRLDDPSDYFYVSFHMGNSIKADVTARVN